MCIKVVGKKNQISPTNFVHALIRFWGVWPRRIYFIDAFGFSCFQYKKHFIFFLYFINAFPVILSFSWLVFYRWLLKHINNIFTLFPHCEFTALIQTQFCCTFSPFCGGYTYSVGMKKRLDAHKCFIYTGEGKTWTGNQDNWNERHQQRYRNELEYTKYIETACAWTDTNLFNLAFQFSSFV